MHDNLVRRCGRWLVWAALSSGIAASALAQPLQPLQAPPAPSRPQADTLHGVTVDDPFRNLEDLQHPDTRLWLQSQGQHTAAQLAGIEGRDLLARRIAELSRESGDAVRSIVRLPGERIYYLKRRAGASQFKLVMRAGLQGRERVLIDPEALARAAGGVPHAINHFSPSWDGRTLAYGISAGGSEDAALHLMDVASGRALRAPLPRVRDSARWSPDSRHLTFNQLRELPPGAPDSETYLDSTVRLWDRKRAQREPRALFGPLVNRELALDRLDVGEVIFAPGSRHMLARTTDTTVPEGRLFVAPLSALQRPSIRWREFAGPQDKITHLRLHHDTIFIRSYADAPRGRVLALAAARPSLERARVVVPEPERGVIEEFEILGGSLLVEVRQGFATRTLRYAMAGSGVGVGVDVAPAQPGSTYGIAPADGRGGSPWLSTSTWTEPSRVLALQPDGSLRDTGLRRNALPAGVPEIEVREVEVESHDGVRVPLAVLHRKGLALDGRRPTLLQGYGAYGLSYSAGFDPRRLAWLERGGVIAYANVRGSGAFGDPWHRAGFKATKPNTWKDGIACARWLIAQGYASAATLGAWGTSAGGIFVGRAVTEAPELFAAAIFDVGVLDAVRSEQSANGATNTSEFGSVKNKAEFEALLAMSTYHQIKPGTAYPGVLLVHGLNDPRVDVWHSAKTAAQLQRSSTSGRPVLLRLDTQAGHGVGSTAQQGDGKLADIYAFLLSQFKEQPKGQ